MKFKGLNMNNNQYRVVKFANTNYHNSNTYQHCQNSYSGSVQNTPPVPKATSDAATQTITRDKNLDPINYARLYISTQVPGESIVQKRDKFFKDTTINQNIRKRYHEYVQDHDHYDERSVKLTKVDRKYHLMDRSLNTNILDMSSEELKTKFPGIGWSYLGLQARMEYQQKYCKDLAESETDAKFFQDRIVSGNLKVGYSRWKSENIISTSSDPPLIKVHDNNPSRTTDDLIPINRILSDVSLNNNILKLNSDEIKRKYESVDIRTLGLEARLEFAKNYDKNEPQNNIDIDFMLAPSVDFTIRSAYRQWLSSHQLVTQNGEIFVKTFNSRATKSSENLE